MTAEEVAGYRRRIDEFAARCVPSGWFHSIDLGNGLVARGHAGLEDMVARLGMLRLPEDLTGQTFLDIGAWDGFYSFEAEQRGARRVLATDSFAWGGPGWGSKQGFLLAREVLRSKVEDQDIDVMEICPERVGTFDVVLLAGVLHHVRDPIQALRNAASVCNRLLIVETPLGFEQLEEPVLGYVPRAPGNALSDHWRPNSAWMYVLLNEVGFFHIERRVVPGGPPSGVFHATR